MRNGRRLRERKRCERGGSDPLSQGALAPSVGRLRVRARLLASSVCGPLSPSRALGQRVMLSWRLFSSRPVR